MILPVLIAQRVDIRSNLAGSPLQFDLGTLIGRIAGVGLIIAGAGTFTYLVWGGVQWTLAGGDKGKIDSARQIITQSLVGLLVTASAFALFRIVQYFLGLDIVK